MLVSGLHRGREKGGETGHPCLVITLLTALDWAAGVNMAISTQITNIHLLCAWGPGPAGPVCEGERIVYSPGHSTARWILAGLSPQSGVTLRADNTGGY